MLAMDASARGWLLKTSVRNYWRVAAWMELDDLIQDGYLHYQRLVNKYPDVTDKPHIMQLFKRTFTNHVHDLSKKRMRTPEQTFSATPHENSDNDGILDKAGSEPELATFRAFLSQAPKPVRDVIALLTKEAGRLAIRAQYRKRNDGTRETVNERLCKLCGYDHNAIDLAWLVRAYLSLT
jgi:hypothetical protein